MDGCLLGAFLSAPIRQFPEAGTRAVLCVLSIEPQTTSCMFLGFFVVVVVIYFLFVF